MSPSGDAAPGAPAGRQVWDNSNIVESYPGITLPLTYSFIRRAYHAVYWQFCQVLGLSRRRIHERDGMLWNMLGLLNGRVYYNLLNWYRLVSLLPGFKFNKAFMEGMMGLTQPAELAEPPAGRLRRCLVELPRLAWTGLRAAWLQLTLSRRVRGFHRDFDAAYRHFAAEPFERMSRSELLAVYAAMEREILWRWKAPIINDFSAMVFYGLLRKLTAAWGVDPDGGLHNALISRQGQIESVRVAEELQELAARVAADPARAERFRKASPEEALELLRADPELARGLEEYLARYGDRSVAELKLETRPMREDPAFCAAMIQNYLRGSPAAGSRGTGLDPEEARKLAAERLAGRRCLGLVPRRRVYFWILARAAAAVRNRENQRLARTRAFGLVRRLFRQVGASLAAEGHLASADDVFYLTVPEIEAFVAGSGPGTPDLRDAAARRRALYERLRALPPLPEHLETPGPVGEEEVLPVAAAPRPAAQVLKGTGACPGVVEAPAAVLLEPDRSVKLAGQILVARQTDPGWVVLFPSVSAILVERGGMLSHSAIVAREMGIPAVVGVSGATELVRTGDRLRLDGGRGTVEILERAPGGAP